MVDLQIDWNLTLFVINIRIVRAIFIEVLRSQWIHRRNPGQYENFDEELSYVG